MLLKEIQNPPIKYPNTNDEIFRHFEIVTTSTILNLKKGDIVTIDTKITKIENQKYYVTHNNDGFKLSQNSLNNNEIIGSAIHYQAELN